MISKIEDEDPQFFDSALTKRKWTHAQKNTTRAIKDQQINNNYWNLLNHLPQDKVKGIVTNRVLEMDRRSCDNMLKSIINDKK